MIRLRERQSTVAGVITLAPRRPAKMVRQSNEVRPTAVLVSSVSRIEPVVRVLIRSRKTMHPRQSRRMKVTLTFPSFASTHRCVAKVTSGGRQPRFRASRTMMVEVELAKRRGETVPVCSAQASICDRDERPQGETCCPPKRSGSTNRQRLCLRRRQKRTRHETEIETRDR